MTERGCRLRERLPKRHTDKGLHRKDMQLASAARIGQPEPASRPT